MDDRGKNTRVVLGLVRHRIAGLLLSQLCSETETNNEYFTLLRDSKGEKEFLDSVGHLVIRAAKANDVRLWNAYGDDFVSSEFGNILWAELSDQLIANGNCEFANFGKFRRSLSSRGLTISFEPNQLFIDPGKRRGTTYRTNLESLKPSHDPNRPAAAAIEAGLPAAEIILADFCLNIVDRVLSGSPGVHPTDSFKEIPKSSPQLAGEFLYAVLQVLMSELPSEFERNEQARSSLNNGLTFLGMGLAMGTYYAWLLAFAIEVAAGARISIPSIGVFYLTEKTTGIVSQGRREKTIVFEAEDDFRKLISVSLPPAPAMAA